MYKQNESEKIKPINLFLYKIKLLIFTISIINIQKVRCVLAQQQHLTTKIITISKTSQEIPLISLSALNPQFQDINLIIDTGSSQIAFFDSQCYDCLQTYSICPHIKQQIEQDSLNYITIKLKGDYSYLMLSEQLRIKFFCVLRIQGDNMAIQSNGILGLRFDSSEKERNNLNSNFPKNNGLSVWKKILLKTYQKWYNTLNYSSQQSQMINKINNLTIKYSFFFSDFQTKLILGNVPQYISKKQVGQLILEQNIQCIYLSFFSSSKISQGLSNNYISQKGQINENQKKSSNNTSEQKIDSEKTQRINVYFDSGSNVVVLPYKHFQILFNQLNKLSQNQQIKCNITQKLMIRCSKSMLKLLIKNQFSLNLKIRQQTSKNTNSNQIINISIRLQNLIDKTTKRHSEQKYFILKIATYGQQKHSNKIILGIPLFKQYILQYSLPTFTSQNGQLNSKLEDTSINIKLEDTSININEHKIIIYDHHYKQVNETLSPYQQLMKKYHKNIKIFTLIYLFCVFLISYLTIKTYWIIHQFIKVKKTIA